MKTFKYFFYTLFITLSSFLYGCNQEDDIYEIFDSGVWQLVNYYTGGDWESNNDRYARPAYTEAQDLESLSKITITFKNDGTFTGTLDGGTFEGKWQADPSDRSFAVIGEIKASIKLSGKNAEFIKKLELTSYYKGVRTLLPNKIYKIFIGLNGICEKTLIIGHYAPIKTNGCFWIFFNIFFNSRNTRCTHFH